MCVMSEVYWCTIVEAVWLRLTGEHGCTGDAGLSVIGMAGLQTADPRPSRCRPPTELYTPDC